MAVLSARSVAVRLVKIQKLSSLYHQEVLEMRRDAVKTTVDALWRRYRAHQKKGEEWRTFVDWLSIRIHLENTFWHRGTGASLATRRDWALRYFAFLTRKELTLADDPTNRWVIDALEEAINVKAHDEEYSIVVQTSIRHENKSQGIRGGVSFSFVRSDQAPPLVILP
jgi:hypothetical protein